MDNEMHIGQENDALELQNNSNIWQMNLQFTKGVNVFLFKFFTYDNFENISKLILCDEISIVYMYNTQTKWLL